METDTRCLGTCKPWWAPGLVLALSRVHAIIQESFSEGSWHVTEYSARPPVIAHVACSPRGCFEGMACCDTLVHFVQLLQDMAVDPDTVCREVPAHLLWYYVFQHDFCFPKFPLDIASEGRYLRWPQPEACHFWFSIRLTETLWPPGAELVDGNGFPFHTFLHFLTGHPNTTPAVPWESRMGKDTIHAVIDAVQSLLWNLQWYRGQEPVSPWEVQAQVAYTLAECLCLFCSCRIVWPPLGMNAYSPRFSRFGLTFLEVFWERVATWPVRVVKTGGHQGGPDEVLAMDFATSQLLYWMGEVSEHRDCSAFVQRAFDLNPAVFIAAQAKRGCVQALGLPDLATHRHETVLSPGLFGLTVHRMFAHPGKVVLALPPQLLKTAVQASVWNGLPPAILKQTEFWDAIGGYLHHASPPSRAWLLQLLKQAPCNEKDEGKDTREPWLQPLLRQWNEWSPLRAAWVAAVYVTRKTIVGSSTSTVNGSPKRSRSYQKPLVCSCMQ